MILGYLAGELRWGIEHGCEAYAVLNACRARVFLADGQIVSKVAGGSIALTQGFGTGAVIRRALTSSKAASGRRIPAGMRRTLSWPWPRRCAPRPGGHPAVATDRPSLSAAGPLRLADRG